VTACSSPDAYTLALPRKMRCRPAANVDRLMACFARAGGSPAPGPVSDAGREGEHEVELLLNRRLVRGVTRYLVRWRGHTSADDEWLRQEELTHCPEKVAEFDAAAPRRHAALGAAVGPGEPGEAAGPRPAAPAPAQGPAPLVAPAGWRLAAAAEVPAEAALIGQAVLYHWPDDGWVRGTIARRTRATGFSHVVRYGRASALGSAEAPSLLDAASYGPAGRWLLLRRAR